MLHNLEYYKVNIIERIETLDKILKNIMLISNKIVKYAIYMLMSLEKGINIIFQGLSTRVNKIVI